MQSLAINTSDHAANIKLAEVNKAVSSSKRMVILTGAGISCNAGIPDFRSTNGLYNMVKQKHPGAVVKGKDLFDISLFRSESTLQVFATFMESLYGHTKHAVPTETHKFIKHLKRQNKLLRCYTQNIDAIERKLSLNTGVVDDDEAERKPMIFRKQWKNLDVVQLHGDLNSLSCSHCFRNFEWKDEFRQVLANGEVPDCPVCLKIFEERMANGKRLSSSTVGFLRPSIVLYGENHPNSESISRGLSMDIKSKPDCLIIFGTSLKVDGVKKLVKTLANEIHDRNGKVIFVNKTRPSSALWNDSIDYFIETDCDSWVRYLRGELPDLFLTQVELDALKLSKKQKQANKANSKKNNVLLTPPPTPTHKDKKHNNNDNNYCNKVDPKTVNTNTKVKKLQQHSSFQKEEEIPSPEFLPVKKDRIVNLDLNLDNQKLTRNIKAELTRIVNLERQKANTEKSTAKIAQSSSTTRQTRNSRNNVLVDKNTNRVTKTTSKKTDGACNQKGSNFLSNNSNNGSKRATRRNDEDHDEDYNEEDKENCSDDSAVMFVSGLLTY